jgi:crotonobetainyl-CoA:carnitine CoA-transferase CaiB-like acyl-CoA transferase
VASEQQWQGLVEWLGRPDWATRIGADLASRRNAQDEIDAELRRIFAERDRLACIEELSAAGVPAARVVDPRTLCEHPQLVARGFTEVVDHALVGAQPTMGAPFRYASVDRWLRHAAPTLGQHNAEILRELGYDDAAIEALTAEGVIGDWPEGVER